jgi:hypothetical protein
MNPDDLTDFRDLTFDDFRRRASDERLSPSEKVGFPDRYRAGKEERIFADIVAKLSNLGRDGALVMDIGPGCSGLALMVVEWCGRRGHRLLLVDSDEMLAHLPDAPYITKVPAMYPRGCDGLLRDYAGRLDAILTYSVFHHVFAEANVWEFVDRSLELLAPGGQMLIGDIPNLSKRNRFFRSARGVAFHRAFTGRQDAPPIDDEASARSKVTDAVVLAVLARCRQAGCDAYVLPQPDDLPMANRREDVVIVKS